MLWKRWKLNNVCLLVYNEQNEGGPIIAQERRLFNRARQIIRISLLFLLPVTTNLLLS